MTDYRALAVALLDDAVGILQRTHSPKEIAFFRDATKSAKWCEMAGLDWEAVVSGLERQGLLTPQPHTKKVPVPKVPTPTRTLEYQRALKSRITEKLPLTAQTACPTRELAQSCGVYFKAAQNALHALKLAGKAQSRVAPLRGGNTALWWRKESSENIDENR